MIEDILLGTGLFFPAVSLVTSILSLVTRWWSDRYASPVFIPFIGPLLLTCWVFVAGHSCWGIPVVWLFDLGTIRFLIAMFRFVGPRWRHPHSHD